MKTEKNNQNRLGYQQIPGGTECILFVDDEEHLADLWKEILESLRYQVTARSSSLDALDVFRESPDGFDLMITDMTMPQMTGAELSKEIKRIRPELPVILYTGFSMQISEKKAEGMGIRRFLTKPLSLAVLAKTIREVLDEG